MKLFHSLTVISALALTCSTALADYRGHNGSRDDGWNHSSSRHSSSRHSSSRHEGRNSHDNGRFITRGNRHHDNHDRWSVSLNFGGGYSSGWFGSSYHTGFYRNRWDNWNIYSPLRSRTSFVYTAPTVIYVNDSSDAYRDRDYDRNPARVIRRTTGSKPVTSLLRDINGNCFERSYDSEGNEHRVQLPASDCNF